MPRTKEGCQKGKLVKEIKECFGITAENNSLINSLVDDLYWQVIKIKECKSKIDKSSLAVEFKQGKQDMLIQNPLIKTYNDLIKNQALTIKSLQTILGKNSKDDDKELKELMGFITKGKKQIR